MHVQDYVAQYYKAMTFSEQLQRTEDWHLPWIEAKWKSDKENYAKEDEQTEDWDIVGNTNKKGPDGKSNDSHGPKSNAQSNDSHGRSPNFGNSSQSNDSDGTKREGETAKEKKGKEENTKDFSSRRRSTSSTWRQSEW